MEPWQLVLRSSAEVVVPDLKIAATFWSRFRGLQFVNCLGAGKGQLIAPCRSVHTHWMRFPIDAVMLNERGVVLNVVKDLRPWRLCSGVPGTRFVLEVAGGTFTRSEGDHLALQPPAGVRIPGVLEELI